MTDQMNLFGPNTSEAEPEYNAGFLLAALPEPGDPANPEGIAVKPDKKLRDSIEKYGVLQPIWVYEDCAENQWVVAGRRRVAAARALGHTTIPALIYKCADGWTHHQVFTLIENNVRGPSPASELEAVESLTAAGYSERQIADEVQVSITRVRKLMELLDLPADLLEGFKRGDIARTVAAKAAKQPESIQRKLQAMYAERGKITGPDVDEAKQVEEQQAIDLWPDLDLPDEPVQPAIPHETVMGMLNRLEGLAGTNADAALLLAVIREMKEELDG